MKAKVLFKFLGILTLFIIIIAVFSILKLSLTPKDNVRMEKFAGSWYPDDPTKLSELVNTFFDKSQVLYSKQPKALIVPHAGYQFSGQVAAHGFKQLENSYINKVIILTQNHNVDSRFSGISSVNYSFFHTPLGYIPVSPESKNLQKNDIFSFVPEAHDLYMIESELPFLQSIIQTDFEIIPLVIDNFNESNVNLAVLELNKIIDDKTLIVVSSDLSHFHDYNTARSKDAECLSSIQAMDLDKTSNCEACGVWAINILMRLAEINDWYPAILNYQNSEDTYGPTDNGVIGYGAVAFYDSPLVESIEFVNKEEQSDLLTLARATIDLKLNYNKIPKLDLDKAHTNTDHFGCFVTLTQNDSLRGCTGDIKTELSIPECVIKHSLNAATNDKRFAPVQAKDLDNIEIEISILNEPKLIQYDSPQDILQNIHPPHDGVILNTKSIADITGKQKITTSTFLPNVWNNFQSRTQFLEALCQKQNADKDCWKSAQIFTYQTQFFKESDFQSKPQSIES